MRAKAQSGMITPLLRLYRSVNHLSQEEMGNLMGVSQSTAHRLESGFQVEGQTLVTLINWLFMPVDRSDLKSPESANLSNEGV